MKKHPVIALVGAPGTGKTYLAKRIAEATNVSYITEPPLVDRIIENFEAAKGDLENQLYFLEQGIQNIKRAHELALTGPVLMDTYWHSTMLYVQHTLDPFARGVVESFIAHLEDHLPLPDTVVWLTAPDEHIVRQVTDRSRDFEVTDEYLERILDLEQAHKDHFGALNCVMIDKSENDFEDDTVLRELISKIRL